MQVPSMPQGDSLKRVQTGPTTGPSQHRIGSARNFSTCHCSVRPTPHITKYWQAAACPRAAQKSATYRSLRFIQVAALVPSAGTITLKMTLRLARVPWSMCRFRTSRAAPARERLMATKTNATPQKGCRRTRVPRPLPTARPLNLPDAAVKKLIRSAKKRGYVAQ
jgi:hypothetical protein